MYGRGEQSIANELGISLEEATAIKATIGAVTAPAIRRAKQGEGILDGSTGAADGADIGRAIL